jgi:uncharacterized membrane protein YuzA (DUF378 family)
MKQLDTIATALLAIGGLNWGLVGLANFDLVAAITGAGSFGHKNALGAIIYTLVGFSAVYRLATWKSAQRRLQTTAA